MCDGDYVMKNLLLLKYVIYCFPLKYIMIKNSYYYICMNFTCFMSFYSTFISWLILRDNDSHTLSYGDTDTSNLLRSNLIHEFFYYILLYPYLCSVNTFFDIILLHFKQKKIVLFRYISIYKIAVIKIISYLLCMSYPVKFQCILLLSTVDFHVRFHLFL